MLGQGPAGDGARHGLRAQEELKLDLHFLGTLSQAAVLLQALKRTGLRLEPGTKPTGTAAVEWGRGRDRMRD